jgi:hypothetical protein
MAILCSATELASRLNREKRREARRRVTNIFHAAGDTGPIAGQKTFTSLDVTMIRVYMSQCGNESDLSDAIYSIYGKRTFLSLLLNQAQHPS